ncbi:nucleoside-diphosphate sugar epimerase [Pseudorhodoferax aquiterrae]|uniref:Nucleoside-diphosphate sugar epimerase n=2 Tax=Pseudorhodoferax aquiterrae TaxID=747304 RepID=A0ABQ3G5F5_9BURK|nr:nucleoside-diphosphate sugar epimerase [Pseudorhodoferax aquiterrae]
MLFMLSIFADSVHRILVKRRAVRRIRRKTMFVVTGVTGKVGGQVARRLLAAGLPVRAVLRDAAKAPAWRALGCETALASMDDAAALGTAFAAAEAIFVLLPPVFDPSEAYAETQAHIAALVAALQKAQPRRVVALSTIGAQAAEDNLLTQLQMMERAFAALTMPVAFLRPAWFMENAAWDIDDARSLGVVSSFLQPLDKPVPMVATADVAATAVQMLQDNWEGRCVVELEGPVRITPQVLASTLGRVLGRDVVDRAVPRATWAALFRSQGMANPLPRIRMLDGFNEGWIEFEAGAGASRKGVTALETLLRGLADPMDALGG